MGSEIAITVAREETRVAVIDGGVVTDLFGDRTKHKDFVGNIYKGKDRSIYAGVAATKNYLPIQFQNVYDGNPISAKIFLRITGRDSH